MCRMRQNAEYALSHVCFYSGFYISVRDRGKLTAVQSWQCSLRRFEDTQMMLRAPLPSYLAQLPWSLLHSAVL